MAGDGITRRNLLRGQALPARGSKPVVKPGQTLPDVISWLDPDMRPTPRRDAHAPFPLLRPPGALAEPDFLAACTRCGDCAEACPHDAIAAAPARLRNAAETPVIDPIRSPCHLCEDLPCIAACEAGALRPEAPAALGTARVEAIDCLNTLSATCSVCVERCLVPGAIDLVGVTPQVNERMCTGCGWCQHACPAPNNAILMLPNPARPSVLELERQAEAARPLELPELREASLDDDGLRALFRDLAGLANIHDIRLKQAPRQRALDATIKPDDAVQLLLDGSARGVQVRYDYDGESWCDTILPAAGGYRVVRVADRARPTGLS